MLTPDLTITDQTKNAILIVMRDNLSSYNPSNEDLLNAFNAAIDVGKSQFNNIVSRSTPTHFSNVNILLTSNAEVISAMREVLGKYNPTDQELTKAFDAGVVLLKKQLGIIV